MNGVINADRIDQLRYIVLVRDNRRHNSSKVQAACCIWPASCRRSHRPKLPESCKRHEHDPDDGRIRRNTHTLHNRARI